MTTTPSDIVVAYDASPGASRALAWAIHVARLEGRSLHAVVVRSAMDPVLSDFHARNVARAERQLGQGQQELVDAGLADASVEVRTGPTAPVLVRAAEGCSMLVVGRRDAEHGSIGPVGLYLGRAAHCPVVVVSPDEGAPLGHGVVVGVDGSSESNAALRFACEHAEALGEPLTVVHAFHPRMAPSPAHDGRHTRTREEVARQQLEEWSDEILRHHPTLEVHQRVVAGSAAKQLVRQSAGASLLVLGCHRHDPLEQLLRGSVSRYALKHAACAVAVVHEKAVA